MTLSSNSFSADSVPKSSNTFSTDRPEVSTNQFADESISKGSNAWDGDNLTSGALPGDMMSGGAPGVRELGGIAHFKARTRPTINHA